MTGSDLFRYRSPLDQVLITSSIKTTEEPGTQVLLYFLTPLLFFYVIVFLSFVISCFRGSSYKSGGHQGLYFLKGRDNRYCEISILSLIMKCL